MRRPLALRRRGHGADALQGWPHGNCPLCGGEPKFSVIAPAARAAADLFALHVALAFPSARLPLVPERRPLEDHLLRHPRRPVSPERLRRVPPLHQSLRRPQRAPARSCPSSTRSRRCRWMRPPSNADIAVVSAWLGSQRSASAFSLALTANKKRTGARRQASKAKSKSSKLKALTWVSNPSTVRTSSCSAS